MAKMTAVEKFPSIDEVTGAVVSTAQAAYYLMRRPQTLRLWAMNESGLLRPIRIGSRLGWRVSEIRKIVGA